MLLISTVHAETFPRYLDTVHSLSRSASFHATRFFPFATNSSQQGLCSTRGGYLQRHTTVRQVAVRNDIRQQHIMLFNDTHHFCIPDWCSSPLCLDLPSRLLFPFTDNSSQGLSGNSGGYIQPHPTVPLTQSAMTYDNNTSHSLRTCVDKPQSATTHGSSVDAVRNDTRQLHIMLFKVFGQEATN